MHPLTGTVSDAGGEEETDSADGYKHNRFSWSLRAMLRLDEVPERELLGDTIKRLCRVVGTIEFSCQQLTYILQLHKIFFFALVSYDLF